jgi:hypothetical protein
MLKKSIISIIVSILFTFIFFTGCGTKTQIQTKGGLKISGWSSGLGSVNGTDLDKSKFSYSINLTNENESIIFIKSVQPSVDGKIINKIINKDIIVTVNKDIKPNETIQVSGEIIFDTKGLTKSDIVKLEPFITDIKVLTEETISLK